MKSFIFCYTVVSHEFEFIILLGLYLSVYKCHVNKLLDFLMGLYTLCPRSDITAARAAIPTRDRTSQQLEDTRGTEDAGRQQGLAGRCAQCVAICLVMDDAGPRCPSRASASIGITLTF